MSQSYQKLTGSQFKLYPYRYVVTILFACVQLMTSVLLSTLNPIAKYLTQIYDQSSTVVNLGGLLFVLMHPIFTFPAAYVIDTYGSRTGIIIGSVLGILGVSLRLLVNSSFAWVIVGQVLAGIGRPFILNCQGKISANWFTSVQRGKITQILTLVLNVSLIIGVIIPTVVFGSYKPINNNDGDNYEQGKKLTFDLMLLHAIMGYIFYGANLIFQRNKPPTPPSEAQKIKRDSFMVSIKNMMTNWNYIKLFIAFGCFFGIFNGMSITLSFMLKPWFSQNLATAVSVVGGSPIISGIIGVGLIGPLQRKSGMYKKWILICMGGSSLAIALFYPLLQTDSLVFASLVSAFNSFFLIPLVPIMLELGCELVFPVGEGTAVGFLFAMGNFSGFLLGNFLTIKGTILSIIVQGDTKSQTGAGLGFCFFIFLIGLLMVFLLKEDLKRSKSQHQNSVASQTIIVTSNQKADNTKALIEDGNINQTDYEPPSENSQVIQKDS